MTRTGLQVQCSAESAGWTKQGLEVAIGSDSLDFKRRFVFHLDLFFSQQAFTVSSQHVLAISAVSPVSFMSLNVRPTHGHNMG